MPRYNGPAQLVQGSNVVDVSCAFDVVREEPSGLRAWFGSWRDPRPAHTLRAGAAILRLPKGQEGDVIIGKIHVGSRTVERASFRGQGAAPDRGAD